MTFDTFYWYQAGTRVDLQYEDSHCWDGIWQLFLGSGDQVIPPDREWFAEERIDAGSHRRQWPVRPPEGWRPRYGALFFAGADGAHNKVLFQRVHVSRSKPCLIYTLVDGSYLERPYVLGEERMFRGMRGEKLKKMMAGRKRDHARLVARLESAGTPTWEADISPVFHVLERDYDERGLRLQLYQNRETGEIHPSWFRTCIYVDALLEDDVIHISERCSDGERNERILAAPFLVYIEVDKPGENSASRGQATDAALNPSDDKAK